MRKLFLLLLVNLGLVGCATYESLSVECDQSYGGACFQAADYVWTLRPSQLQPCASAETFCINSGETRQQAMARLRDKAIEQYWVSCHLQSNAEACLRAGSGLASKGSEMPLDQYHTVADLAENLFQKACDLGLNPSCMFRGSAYRAGAPARPDQGTFREEVAQLMRDYLTPQCLSGIATAKNEMLNRGQSTGPATAVMNLIGPSACMCLETNVMNAVTPSLLNNPQAFKSYYARTFSQCTAQQIRQNIGNVCHKGLGGHFLKTKGLPSSDIEKTLAPLCGCVASELASQSDEQIHANALAAFRDYQQRQGFSVAGGGKGNTDGNVFEKCWGQW